MFAFIITVHVIACFLLIVIVLVQQGKGGGLIDTLSSAESIFGTKTNTFLVKATSVLSVVFFFTCLSLAFMSLQRNKSLIDIKYKTVASSPLTRTQSQKNPLAKVQEKSQAAATTSQAVPAVTQEKVDVKPEQATSAIPAAVPQAAPTPVTQTPETVEKK